ncbi:MFS transporter, partial [Solemya velum gill symbiont]|uniref:MFS transporter n=1 Tax=Solemya velum gill symbiont TaxID=2340 RepID=UPI000996E752
LRRELILYTRPPLVILYLALLAPAALHLPQPLLPSLTDLFEIESADTALLMTATLLPLGLMPIAYGYLLEGVSTRTMLYVSAIGIAITQLWMWAMPDYSNWFAARVALGLLQPALMTAAMTYASATVEKSARPHAMGLYIAGTIIGGFFGRMMAGWVSESFDLVSPPLVMAFLYLCAIPALHKLPREAGAGFARIRWSIAKDIFALPRFRAAYTTTFIVFFIFTAVTTLLPFEMRRIDPLVTNIELGLLYLGYLVGLIVSLNIRRLKARFKPETRLVISGLLMYIIGTVTLLKDDYLYAVGSLFFFCGGMFLVHTTLTGLLNRSLDHHHGVINGLYLAFYYTGGALGSHIPSRVYANSDWESVIFLCSGLIIFTLFLIHELKQEPALEDSKEK